MRVLHESDFYRVEQLEGRVLKVTRKDKPFESRQDVEAACVPVQRALDLAGRALYPFLVAPRRVAGRNDPQPGAMFAAPPPLMGGGFRAVALLVKTPAGLLQTQRLLREGGSRGRVFLDEEEAVAFLRGGPPPSKPPRGK